MNIAPERRPLSLYPLRLTLSATEPLSLDDHPGSSLRGALFSALLRRFCVNPTAPSCAVCPLNTTCPVAGLVAPLRDERPHGRDVPRPFVLQAPASGARVFAPGQSFTLGLTLIGVASRFFPYVALAAQVMEAQGIGRPLAVNGGRRGRFQVEHIDVADPYAVTDSDASSAIRQALYTRGSPRVTAPTRPMTADDIATRAASLPDDRLTLSFVSPTRLIEKGALIRTPQLPILVARLAERLDALTDEYGATSDEQSAQVDHQDAERVRYGADASALPHLPSGEQRAQRREQTRLLMEEAAHLRVVQDDTRWIDVASYSARQGRATPIGGFEGRCAWRGEVSQALRELLVWGELLHVGKNAVKGDGQYRMMSELESRYSPAPSDAPVTRVINHSPGDTETAASTATTKAETT